MIDLKMGLVGKTETGGKSELLIAGGGPAAYTAAVYAGRYRLDTVVIEGYQPGGQLALTHAIENFPGHFTVSGAELSSTMRKQAESTGVKLIQDQVIETSESGSSIIVKTGSGQFVTDALIIATGATPKKIGIPGEEKFFGRGVSYCATCDAPFFKDRHILVVGGGDTAVKEALYLIEYASRITLIHRRDELRAEPVLSERLLSHPEIEVLWSTTIEEITGEEGVESVKLKTPEGFRNLKTDGVFMFIGWTPATEPFKNLVDLREDGAVITHENIRTSAENVFAAGDVRDTELRQVITAASDGARAAFTAFELLRGH